MDRLAAWVLGTWHACALLVAFLLIAHAAGAAGGLTAGIGTAAGVLAFGWLWVLTVWSARRVLDDRAVGRVALHAGMYGAGAGALFVAGLGGALVIGAAFEAGEPSPLVGLLFVAAACLPASLVGMLIGWLLLGVDLALLGPATRAIRQAPTIRKVSPDPRQRP